MNTSQLMNGGLVFLGGGLGSLLRYNIGLFFKNLNSHIPFGTLTSNAIASFLIAIFMLISFKFNDSKNTILFLSTGLCGGLSTFSTFSWETFQLIQNGQWTWVVINVALNLFVCLGLIYVVSRSIQ
ncbi:MAG: fluoride efflux transporter CrcB [Bacteroidota bacterium]